MIEDERGRLVVRRQPLGVCVGIVPWNFPLIVGSLKIGPALLAGNTMIVKVPEFGPLATLEALSEMAALLPPGVLNVVSGFGPEVGRALVTHPKVRKVAFTGSTETGRQVMADAAGHLARLSLELGGNDAAVLLDDVDLSDQAIERLVTGAFMHTGQICIDIKRIYVHESRYDELVDKLRAAVDQIVVGDGTRPEVTMGPINNSRQYDKVTKLLAETKEKRRHRAARFLRRGNRCGRRVLHAPAPRAEPAGRLAGRRDRADVPDPADHEVLAPTTKPSRGPTAPSTAWRRRCGRPTRTAPSPWPTGWKPA